MKKTSSSIHTFLRRISIMALVIVVTCMSCSKDEEPTPIPVPAPTPPATPPSGVIQYFTISQSVVPYKTSGAILKWLVDGTNTLTKVYINDTLVAQYGIQDAGRLKQTTKFVLKVNSGARDSLVLRVADSVTTLLWNKGRRLKLIQREKYTFPPNSVLKSWVLDTPYSPVVLDERIYFSYSNTSEILQLTANRYVALADGGKFTVSKTQDFFSWRGTIYTILLLDEDFLVVEFDEVQWNGSTLKIRQKYRYEPG